MKEIVHTNLIITLDEFKEKFNLDGNIEDITPRSKTDERGEYIPGYKDIAIRIRKEVDV